MTLSDRLAEFRNRLISNPAVRHKLQKIPVIQNVANKSAERLFAICAGFIHSQVLLFCVRVGLLERLARRAAALEELSADLGIEASRLEKMLRAATALRLVERRSDGAYRPGMLGAALADNDGLKALILHHDALYRDLEDPVAMAESAQPTRLAQYWAYSGSTQPAAASDGSVTPYSAVMGASQRMIAEHLAGLDVFAGSRRILDVGGGDGTLAIEIARHHREAQLTVADLPAVCEIAQARVAAAGLSDRIGSVGLDFFRESLPIGHDTACLVRILHDHEEQPVQALLRAVFAALPAGGRLVIAEPMAADGSAGRLIDAYFSIYLLAMGQGRPRTRSHLKTLLEGAGFEAVRRHFGVAPTIATVLSARRPR